MRGKNVGSARNAAAASTQRKIVCCAREWKHLALFYLLSVSVFINLRSMFHNVFEWQLNRGVTSSLEEEEKGNNISSVDRTGTNDSQGHSEERLVVHNSTITNASSLLEAFVGRTKHSQEEEEKEQLVNNKKTNGSALWEAFMENNTKCFFIEDFCHSSNRWFYHPGERGITEVSRRDPSEKKTKTKQQPRFEFQNKKHYSVAGYPANIIMDHIQEADDSFFNELRCKYSSIPNHVIVYSEFNQMLGEFYSRSLILLYRQFTSSFRLSQLFENSTTPWPASSSSKETLDKFEEFLEHTQLYLHLEYPTRKLLESHHLFTSLFRTHPLLDLTALLHDPKCQCFNRVAFCGYKAQQQQHIPTEMDISVNSTNKAATTRQQHSRTILTPALRLPVSPPDTRMYSGLRNLFRWRLIHSNRFVQNDIQQYRAEVLLQHGVDDDSSNKTSEEADEWKIVGLTQRTGRRRWKNLDSVLQDAGRSLRKEKIILVEVNLEENGWNPYTHLIRHAALDGLVGIHGAQLTEAIWMPPGSLVVELLPYIHERQIGHWTRTTDGTTPLGRIYTNTDLNHVGVPLDRESAPLCLSSNKQNGVLASGGYENRSLGRSGFPSGIENNRVRRRNDDEFFR